MMRLERRATVPTQSKHSVPAEAVRDNARNFRIIIRFFDHHETERMPDPRRAAAAWECPRRKFRVSTENVNESRRDASLAPTKH